MWLSFISNSRHIRKYVMCAGSLFVRVPWCIREIWYTFPFRPQQQQQRCIYILWCCYELSRQLSFNQNKLTSKVLHELHIDSYTYIWIWCRTLDANCSNGPMTLNSNARVSCHVRCWLAQLIGKRQHDEKTTFKLVAERWCHQVDFTSSAF